MYNKNRPKRLRPKLLGSEHILGRTGERPKRLENCESCLSCMFIRPCFEISVLYRNVVIWLRTTVKIYIYKKKKTFFTIIYDVFLCSWVSTSSTNPLHRLTIPTSTLLREHRTNYLPSLQLVYTVFVRRTGL